MLNLSSSVFWLFVGQYCHLLSLTMYQKCPVFSIVHIHFRHSVCSFHMLTYLFQLTLIWRMEIIFEKKVPEQLLLLFQGVILRENAWERCQNSHGNAVPIVNVFKNALWTALQTIFRPKMHCRIFHVQQCLNFSEGDTPSLTAGGATPSRIHPQHSQAPPLLGPSHRISAWLASVPIVPVLRNDNCAVVYRSSNRDWLPGN